MNVPVNIYKSRKSIQHCQTVILFAMKKLKYQREEILLAALYHHKRKKKPPKEERRPWFWKKYRPIARLNLMRWAARGPLKALFQFLAHVYIIHNTQKLQGLASKIENPIILPKGPNLSPVRDCAAVAVSSSDPSLSARALSPARAVFDRHQGQSFLPLPNLTSPYQIGARRPGCCVR